VTEQAYKPRGPRKQRSLEEYAYAHGVKYAALHGIGELPWERWKRDPVAYVKERLLEPIVMPHQVDILRALASGAAGTAMSRVSVRSGHKPGKTRLAIWAVCWFFECFDGALVYLCAAIEKQTKNVLWAELERVVREARARGVEIAWQLPRSPSGGVMSVDGSRRIIGIAGREVESLAGLSGRLFFVIDEASSLPANKAEAFHGNMLGGGLMLWISNPTRTVGPFFETFFSQKEYWQNFWIDCEKVAAWVDDNNLRKLLPYVTNRSSVLEARGIYGGVDNPIYKIRVRGEFVLNEQGRAISLAEIIDAHERWEFAPEDGVLTVGLDPAGPGKGGDDTAFALRRGNKVLCIFRFSGITEDDIIQHLLAFLRQYKHPDEEPIVNVDAEGPIGGSLYGRLRAISNGTTPGHRFTVFSVRASLPARREPQLYERTREELFANLAKWLREGGAIPPDPKLDAELHDPVWIGQVGPKLKLSSKEQSRERLGRSTDGADAVALSVWTAVRTQPAAQESPAHPTDVYFQQPFQAQASADDFYQVPDGMGGSDGF